MNALSAPHEDAAGASSGNGGKRKLNFMRTTFALLTVMLLTGILAVFFGGTVSLALVAAEPE